MRRSSTMGINLSAVCAFSRRDFHSFLIQIGVSNCHRTLPSNSVTLIALIEERCEAKGSDRNYMLIFPVFFFHLGFEALCFCHEIASPTAPYFFGYMSNR